MNKIFNQNNIKLLNKVLFLVMALGTGLIAYLEYGNNSNIRIATFIIIYPIILLPYVLKYTKLNIEEDKLLLYYIFIFIADFLGCVVNLYNNVTWYDLFVHFISGIFTFILGIIIYQKLNKNKKDNIILKVLFSLGIVAIIIILWETIEFLGDNIVGSNLQHNIETGVVDTMEDMVVAILGGIISSVYYIIKKK